jgi:hypothetical protein
MPYTAAYSPKIGGWSTFYSYRPEKAISMSNDYFTFKGDNLYLHHDKTVRRVNNAGAVTETQFSPSKCTYYAEHLIEVTAQSGSGAASLLTSDLGYSEANISSTFNDAPLDTKLFKTIEIEGDKPSLSLTTIGDAGAVSSFDYVTKENTHYAYIRGDVSNSLDLRYTKGVGEIDTIVTVGLEHPSATHRYTFPLTHQFDGMINQGNPTAATGGDLIFGPLGNFGRVVKVIDRFNLKAIETIQLNPALLPSAGDYLKVIKDNNVESLGLRGTYMDFTMRFSGSVFTVGTEAMKSFP